MKAFDSTHSYLKKLIVWRWVGWRLNQSTKEVQGRAKRRDLRGISGRFGAAVGATLAADARYAHPRLRLGRSDQKNFLHKDMQMRGTNTSIIRLTKQNAATFGVSLVVLGPR